MPKLFETFAAEHHNITIGSLVYINTALFVKSIGKIDCGTVGIIVDFRSDKFNGNHALIIINGLEFKMTKHMLSVINNIDSNC